MRILRSFSVVALSALVLAGGALSAQAGNPGSKPTVWFWWPSHWSNQDFVPYVKGAKIPNNANIERDEWQVSMWTDEQSKEEILTDLYRHGILNRQYMRGNIPVLEVGPAFMHLSAYEQRRIAKFIDDAFNVTQGQENGIYYVDYAPTEKTIGLYTRYGLQFQ